MKAGTVSGLRPVAEFTHHLLNGHKKLAAISSTLPYTSASIELKFIPALGCSQEHGAVLASSLIFVTSKLKVAGYERGNPFRGVTVELLYLVCLMGFGNNHTVRGRNNATEFNNVFYFSHDRLLCAFRHDGDLEPAIC